jgi:hypothetical protein
VQKTRSVLKTNCRDRLDHAQPMWFRSFRSELSRGRNYCRGVQEIQGEFRWNLSETHAGMKAEFQRTGCGPILRTEVKHFAPRLADTHRLHYYAGRQRQRVT